MLYVFDLDDTTIVSFMRSSHTRMNARERRESYGRVEPLPGRKVRIRELLDQGHKVAFATNQGGIAMGYQKPDDVEAKVRRVLEVLELGFIVYAPVNPLAPVVTYPSTKGVYVYVAPGHPTARFRPTELASAAHVFFRKPGPGMLLKAMVDYRTAPADTVFVGDMHTDREAAAAAQCGYCDVGDFFPGDEPA